MLDQVRLDTDVLGVDFERFADDDGLLEPRMRRCAAFFGPFRVDYPADPEPGCGEVVAGTAPGLGLDVVTLVVDLDRRPVVERERVPGVEFRGPSPPLDGPIAPTGKDIPLEPGPVTRPSTISMNQRFPAGDRPRSTGSRRSIARRRPAQRERRAAGPRRGTPRRTARATEGR